VNRLRADLRAFNRNSDFSAVYTHLSPYENLGVTRSIAYRTLSDRDNDPFDNRPARYLEFTNHLDELIPRLRMHNLDPDNR